MVQKGGDVDGCFEFPFGTPESYTPKTQDEKRKNIIGSGVLVGLLSIDKGTS